MAAADWRAAVGRVEVDGRPGGQGVLVTSRHVLTTRHVVGDSGPLAVIFAKTQGRAKVVEESPREGWALLELGEEVAETKPAPLAVLPPGSRPKVQWFWHPPGHEPVTEIGEIVAEGIHEEFGRVLEVRPADAVGGYRGMSGAPIVTDDRVVGLLSGLDGKKGVFYATSTHSFLEWATHSLANDPTFSTSFLKSAEARGSPAPVNERPGDGAERVEGEDERADGGPHEAGDTPPSACIHQDRWTTRDIVGYRLYAVALREFIEHRETQPPLVVGIQAPWGQGKTSVMRMIQQELDPDHPDLSDEPFQVSDETEPTQLQFRDVKDAAKEGADRAPTVGGGSRRTVWFNAWKYQNSEQIWAGLGHCILTQLTGRIGSKIDRERFWLKLQRDRIDVSAVRRHVHALMLEKAVPWAVLLLLAVLLGAGAALAYEVISPLWTLSSISGGGLAVGVATWALARRRAWSQRIEGAAVRYVQEPGYEGKRGFLQLVERDMQLVMKHLVPDDQPVVVFIDDLDRCAPSKVAEVMEAINMFLAGGFARCVFVIGMDAEVVAAAMEVAHEDIVAKLPHRRRDLGWRFMDKFVQLPFVLPVLRRQQREDYLDRLLSQQREPGVDAALALQVKRFREAAETSETSLEQLQDDYEALLAKLETGGLEARQEAGEAMIRGGARRLEDAAEATAAELHRWMPHLSDNPRTIKRVVNLYRFHRFAAWARQAQGLPAASPRQLARWVLVLVRWPHFVRWIQVQAHGRSEHPVDLVVRLARECEDIREWTERLEDEYEPPPSWSRDAQLHALLRDDVEDSLSLRNAIDLGVW